MATDGDEGAASKAEDASGTRAVVLDILHRGRSEDNRPRYRRSPVAFALGMQEFGLYELLLVEDTDVTIGDRIVIDGPEAHPDLEEYGTVDFEDMTGGAQSELEYAIDEIIESEEDRFVEFFNDAQPITTRLHSLDLLPGIGNTLRNNILDTRRREPIDSLTDIEERVSGLHDPHGVVADRILEEIRETDLKYRLFARNR